MNMKMKRELQQWNVQEVFGARVRQRRRQLKLSQEALGKAAEVDRSNLSRIERGIDNPALVTITRIANALRMPLSRLLREERIDS